MCVQAIVGANAFAHESGIHQDGMLKNKETYEIITPEEIGLVRADEAGLVMGEARGMSCCTPSCICDPHDLSGESSENVQTDGPSFLRVFCLVN